MPPPFQRPLAAEAQVAGGTSAVPINVFLTGFGPFSGVPVNPSWQAIKTLQGSSFTRKDGRSIRLHCAELEVSYDEVLSKVPLAHGRKFSSRAPNPAHLEDIVPRLEYDLFIHIGVSPSRRHVSIEKKARRYGYIRRDANFELCRGAIDPKLGTIRYGLVDPEFDDDVEGELRSIIDTAKLSQLVTKTGLAEVHESSDAGLFICEFTFYTSIASARAASLTSGVPEKPVIFIHVPSENNPYALTELTQVVLNTIVILIEDIR